MINVLLTAVGRRSYLVNYFREALHPLGGKVYAVNTSSDTTGFIAADDAVIVPPSSSEKYVDTLLDLCQKWKVKLLFSLHDWDAPTIARSRNRFLDIGVMPVMGSANMLGKCLDKLATVSAMELIGVPTPKTFVSLADADEFIEEFGFPLIVKPRWGQGSIGLFKIFSYKELKAAYYLSEMAAKRFARVCPEIDESKPQVIIQQCVEGDEFGCDVVNDLNGIYRRCFIKRKFGMRSGETDVAESIEVSSLEKYASRVGQWSKHAGCLDSDWIIDENGKPYLIELNPRFGGGYPFTHAAGGNIVKACIDWACGIDNDMWQLDYKVGVRVYKEFAITVSRNA